MIWRPVWAPSTRITWRVRAPGLRRRTPVRPRRFLPAPILRALAKVRFTATVTGSSPTGTVQFYVDGSAFGIGVRWLGFGDLGQHLQPVRWNPHRYGGVLGRWCVQPRQHGHVDRRTSVGQATAGTVVTSSGSPSLYQSSVTFTATINGEYGNVQGKQSETADRNRQRGVERKYWCGTTAVTSGNPGIATCTTTVSQREAMWLPRTTLVTRTTAGATERLSDRDLRRRRRSP